MDNKIHRVLRCGCNNVLMVKDRIRLRKVTCVNAQGGMPFSLHYMAKSRFPCKSVVKNTPIFLYKNVSQ
jgi:hypothetical protein